MQSEASLNHQRGGRSPGATTAELSPRLFWLLIVASLALRIPGIFHDFWLDEIWSYLIVRELVSPFDVLLQVHVDNSHPLNSWFLYGLGEQATWFVYRIPSLLFGTGSVALAGRIMLRRGRAHAAAAIVLVGCSYPLIVYASEARGYAPLIFFVLLAIDALERYFVTRGWAALITFWLALVFGFFSHLTFFHAYAALLLWSGYEEWKRASDFREALANLAACHAVPLLFLVEFYLVYVRHLRVAGAEPASLLSVIGETIAVALGIPGRGAWPWIALLMVVVLLAMGLRAVKRLEPGLVILSVAGILLIPGLTVFIELQTTLMEPRFFPRYFLVGITLFLLLTAWVVGEQYEHGGRRFAIAATFVSLFLIGNLWQVACFIAGGRGHYRDALRYMSHETRDWEITVSSNSDFRTRLLLTFYRRYLPPDKTLTFYLHGATDIDNAEWRIVEDLQPNAAMPEQIDDGHGQGFRLMKIFPFYGLSGCQWSLYQRIRLR